MEKTQIKEFTAEKRLGDAGSNNARMVMDLIVKDVEYRTGCQLKPRVVQGLTEMNYCLFGVGKPKLREEIQNYRQTISDNFKNPVILEILLDAGSKVESLGEMFSGLKMQISKYLIMDSSKISIEKLNGKIISIKISHTTPKNTNFDEFCNNLETFDPSQKLAINNKNHPADYEATSGTSQSYSWPNTRDSFQSNTQQPFYNYSTENKNPELLEPPQKLSSNNRYGQFDYESGSNISQFLSLSDMRESFQSSPLQPSYNWFKENKNLEPEEPYQKPISNNKFGHIDYEGSSDTSKSYGRSNTRGSFQSNTVPPSNSYLKEISMQEETVGENSRNQDKSIECIYFLLNDIQGEVSNIEASKKKIQREVSNIEAFIDKINNIIAKFQVMKAAGNKPNDSNDRDPDPFIRIMNSLSSSIDSTRRGEKMECTNDENITTYEVDKRKEEIQSDYGKENKGIDTTDSGRPFVPEKHLSRPKKKNERSCEEGTKPETRAVSKSSFLSSDDEDDHKHNRQNLANKVKIAKKKNVKAIISQGYDKYTRGETNGD